MLEGRLYRAAFLPLLPVLIIVAFSLRGQPAPLGSTLSPNLFSGTSAIGLLRTMETTPAYTDRRPGSPGDDALAQWVAGQLSSATSVANGTSTSTTQPFAVNVRRVRAQTIDGLRTLDTVIATHIGSVNGQIVVIAHRDAAAPGSYAELSGTAALLELGQVLAGRLTNHTLTLVSTSGGSGGDAGAIDFARNTGGPVDAVIVLGDVAGGRVRTPMVIPWSDAIGSAPLLLTRTVASSLSGELGTSAGGASFLTQFAHLAFPFAIGEQGPLDAAGLPAVLVQVSGEQGPSPHEAVDETRMQNVGRGVLAAVNALDQDPNAVGAPDAALALGNDTLPAWAVRLLVLGLLFPSLIATLDAFARVRRRGEAVGRGLLWAVSCALPFLFAALVAVALGLAGALPASPPEPVAPGVVPIDALALVVVGLAFALGWAGRGALLRATGLAGDLGDGARGVALLVVLDATALVVWIVDPFAALLLVPAAHLWLLIAAPELRTRRAWLVLALLVSLVLPVGVIALYAHQLGAAPLPAAWITLLLVAGGHIGLVACVLWSIALGSVVVAGLIVAQPVAVAEEAPAVTVRGPLGYAGPGSLGGTESALRR